MRLSQNIPGDWLIDATDISDGYLVKIDEGGNAIGPGTSAAPGDLISIRLSTTKTGLPTKLPITDICDREVGVVDCQPKTQECANEEPWRLGAGYEETARWHVPNNLASGVYFIAWHKDLMFVLRPEATPEVFVLVSTNTFNAYSRTKGRSLYRQPTQTPELSFYRPQGRSKPDEWVEMAKWLSTERDLHDRIGFITDADLEDPDVLDGAKALVILPHSEYWTRAARLCVDRFVERGGNVVVATGNAMWWQVRLDGQHKDRLICFKSDGSRETDREVDPCPDPLLKTVTWNTDYLELDPLRSVGANFKFGGYGQIKKPQALGRGGLRVAEPKHKLFAGLKVREKQFLPIYWSREYDGAPIVGLDQTGIPVADLSKLECAEFQLLMYEWTFRAGHTIGTTHLFRKTPTSGFVLHLGAKDICQNFVKRRPEYLFTVDVVKALINNALRCALDGSTPFDQNIGPREIAIPFVTPFKGKLGKRVRNLAALSENDPRPSLRRKQYMESGYGDLEEE